MSDSKVRNWLKGENILKKFPGFAVLKNTLAAMTELGISLSVATAITIELKIFENRTPLATATEVRRINFFISLSIRYNKYSKNLLRTAIP